MKIFESHFWYSKRQRNGIFFLLTLLLSVQLVYHFTDFSTQQTLDDSEFALLQQQLDSLKEIGQRNGKPQVRPFNPNYLSDFKGYQLGMSMQEIDRLLDYRKAGNFVNSDLEFQKVTGISDSLLSEIVVHFRFPEWVKKKNLSGKASLNSSALKGMSDLNTAPVEQLTRVKGMEFKIARRIVAYRKLLKGYSMNDQLYEVYGISRELADSVLIHFSVLNRPSIEKLNLNEADFKSILHTPYLNYELTKKIFEFKDRNGIFQSVEDLKKIDSFPLEKFDRIALYLTAE